MTLHLVVRVEDVQTRRRGNFAFDHSPVHVGRSELNDLVLPHPVVSLWHGVISFGPGSMGYVDSGSRNGTSLDGTALAVGQAAELEPGQKLVIGPLEFRLATQEDSPEGRPDNTVQRQLLFGELQVDPLASPGQTMFGRGLRVHAPEVPVGEETQKPAFPGLTPAGAAGLGSPEETVIIEQATTIGRPPGPPEVGQGSGRGSFAELDQACEDLEVAVGKVQRQIGNLLVGRTQPERKKILLDLLANYNRLSEMDLLSPWTRTTPGSAHEQRHPARPPPPFALRLLNQFASSYVQGRSSLESEADIERFLDRLAEVLETFSKGFIELRRGLESFGEQMGVGSPSRGDSRLNAFENIPRVLEYLLDESRADGRVAGLTRGFADVMVHQVALMGGVRKGVRAVLEQLAPDTIDRLARRKSGPSLMEAIAPASKRWGLYSERHKELVEDEAQLTQLLFGKAFARAYAVVARGAPAGGSREEEE